MPSRKLILFFRGLIILEVLIVVFTTIYSTLIISYLPQDWQDLKTWDGDGGVLNDVENLNSVFSILMVIFALLLLALMVYRSIGLFFFHQFARKLNVILLCVGFVLIPFFGVTIQLPWEALLCELCTYCDAGALFLSYFSEIKNKFKST